jgi:hypothetical protein
MVWDRRSITLTAAGVAAAVALAVAGIIIATRGDTAGHLASAPKPPASPSPSPSPSHQGPLRSPFTGERVHRLKRVLIAKIGNTFPERPPRGLARADIVYLIPVEGGLSRIMAVFSSHYPRVIGPVRSARQDDLALLRQFGRPAFAWSGAQPRLQRVVPHARIVNLFAGTTSGYFRSPDRVAPYNLYANTRTLLKHARHASVARDIGFRFGAAPNGGHNVKSKSVSFPAASFRFTWSPHQHRWLVSMDDTRATSVGAGRLSAPTVVIQRVVVGLSRFLEQGPMKPPDAHSVGSGTALVLRNGKAYHARWSRPSANGGTRFTTSSGKPMTFARGPVWIVLAYGPGSSRWRSGKPV